MAQGEYQKDAAEGSKPEGRKPSQENYLKLLAKSIVVGLVIGLAIGFGIFFLSSMMIVKKPAIYLYPETPSQVSVQVLVNGKITASEPEYGKGWNVLASPDGKIDGKYDYLFYEAELRNPALPSGGWVVEHAKIGEWFDTMLPRLGLNEREAGQFKEYWLKELPPARYYEMRLLSGEYLRDNLALQISPTPDTVIRAEFYFRPLEEKKALAEPVIVTPKRRGFVVVEWGGILAD